MCVRNLGKMQSHEDGNASSDLMPIISASVLACDFSCLHEEAKRVLDGGAHWLHLDVMDGHFVPNISFGPPILQSLRKKMPNAFFDVHLMVSDPERWIEPFKASGSNIFSFHFEAVGGCDEAIELATKVKCAGMRAGLAVKPLTPVSDVFKALDSRLFSMVVIMTVEPGFGGQSFMWDMLGKVKDCRERYPWLDVEVDGGLGVETTEAAAAKGANVIVAGTSIFKAKDIPITISTMLKSVEKSLKALA